MKERFKPWYKDDNEPKTIWINDDYLIQLNVTGLCPLNCGFCYIKKRYTNKFLNISKIISLWENLRKYHFKYKILYRVNLTGGDIFYHPQWKKIADFLSEEKSVKYVDPLINRFWKKSDKELLSVLEKKITFVQFNLDVVTEDDIKEVEKIGKRALVKVAVYDGKIKNDILKAKKLMSLFPNTLYVSADLIIPQMHAINDVNNCSVINNFQKIRDMLSLLKNECGKNFRVSNPILAELAYGKKSYCPVPHAGMCVLPDGSVSICPKYPQLKTSYNVKNFDLLKYTEKYQKLVSTTCLFDNKYFTNYFKDKDNPINFLSESK